MTNFEKIKEDLTTDSLANLLVKVVIVNNSEAYYVTSFGQLYPMTAEGFKAAVNLEKTILEQEIEEKENNSDLINS